MYKFIKDFKQKYYYDIKYYFYKNGQDPKVW